MNEELENKDMKEEPKEVVAKVAPPKLLFTEVVSQSNELIPTLEMYKSQGYKLTKIGEVNPTVDKYCETLDVESENRPVVIVVLSADDKFVEQQLGKLKIHHYHLIRLLPGFKISYHTC